MFFLRSAIHALKVKQLKEGTPRTESVPVLDTKDWKELEDGIRPADDQLISVESAERILKRKFKREDAQSLVHCLGWVYVKWQDLQYETGMQNSVKGGEP